MKIVYSDKHAQHDPQTFFVRGVKQRSAEQPERAERLLAAAKGAGHEVVAATAHGAAPAETVHTPEYIDFLKTIARDWAKLPNASAEVVPNVHPAHYPATYPKALAGRAGWHQVDLACPIGPHTWEAAVAASESAATAADLVLGGAREAYALCRPPGHHAYADMAGGFCFLNNTAIAAQRLRQKHQRVAVLDVDVHHGNGTQGIFFERDDVLTVSIHADPDSYYP
jgi:acetoin utilization deacetylase AcuC-like enzyme